MTHFATTLEFANVSNGETYYNITIPLDFIRQQTYINTLSRRAERAAEAAMARGETAVMPAPAAIVAEAAAMTEADRV